MFDPRKVIHFLRIHHVDNIFFDSPSNIDFSSALEEDKPSSKEWQCPLTEQKTITRIWEDRSEVKRREDSYLDHTIYEIVSLSYLRYRTTPRGTMFINLGPLSFHANSKTTQTGPLHIWYHNHSPNATIVSLATVTSTYYV